MSADSRVSAHYNVHPLTHTENVLLARAKAWKRMKRASLQCKLSSMSGNTRAEVHYLDLWARYRSIALGYDRKAR